MRQGSAIDVNLLDQRTLSFTIQRQTMDDQNLSATDRAFATPELLEQILVCLLDDLLSITDQEDPRSVRTHSNTHTLTHLLHCSEVNRTWHQCILGSARLQRALFLLPDDKTGRSWHQTSSMQIDLPLYSYRVPSSLAPMLNPVIQTTFPTYSFRFWHLSPEASGHKYCAYLILTRCDLEKALARPKTDCGHTVSSMLLSQPPCTALEASVWDERAYETNEPVGRTSTLRDPVISCDDGLTMGRVHERVGEMFREYRDVAAIKLTTA